MELLVSSNILSPIGGTQIIITHVLYFKSRRNNSGCNQMRKLPYSSPDVCGWGLAQNRKINLNFKN